MSSSLLGRSPESSLLTDPLGLDVLAGALVKPGPSGAPPVGLRAFEVVTVDPSVAPGLVRPLGASVMSIAGDKFWTKVGAGARQWSPLHAVGGVLGAPGDVWDTTALVADLACDTLGGFRLVVDGSLVAGVNAQIRMRRNGANLITGTCKSVYENAASNPGVISYNEDSGLVGPQVLNVPFRLVIESVGMVRSGIYPCMAFYFHGACRLYGSGLTTADHQRGTIYPFDATETHSIGIYSSTGGGVMSADTSFLLERI